MVDSKIILLITILPDSEPKVPVASAATTGDNAA